MKELTIFCLCFFCLRTTCPTLLGQTNLPGLQLLRAEEDYRPLRNQYLDSGLERLKFLPIGDTASVSLGGEARYLSELFRNNGWQAASGTTGWLLQRYMVHADVRMGTFRLFGQLHSAWQSFTEEAPRSIDEDQLDIHQLFLAYTVSLSNSQQLTLRLGRQEFWLGSRRLVSVREGPNVRQSFDAARLIYTFPNWRMDAIYARLVDNKSGVFDNTSSADEQWWSLYAVGNELIGTLSFDFYYLGFYSTRRVYDQGNGTERRHTIGTRWWTDTPLRLNAEFAYQFGEFGTGTINAYTISLDISKTLELPLEPTIGLRTELISGDRDRDNPDLQTFNAFYPRGAYFGLIALIGPANLIDVHPFVSVPILPNLEFTFDWDVFWRHRTTDGIYGPNKALERSGRNSNQHYIGHQPGFEFAYQRGRYLSFSFEGSYFVSGPFFAETGSAADVFHFAAACRFKF